MSRERRSTSFAAYRPMSCSASTAALDQVKAAAQSETVQKTLSDSQNIVGSYLKRSK
jgi:hypothetical protein